MLTVKQLRAQITGAFLELYFPVQLFRLPLEANHQRVSNLLLLHWDFTTSSDRRHARNEKLVWKIKPEAVWLASDRLRRTT
jgi:hypothetical protein